MSLWRCGFDPSPALWIQNPGLLRLWCRSQLWLGCGHWPRNFHMPWVRLKKKKKKYGCVCCMGVGGLASLMGRLCSDSPGLSSFLPGFPLLSLPHLTQQSPDPVMCHLWSQPSLSLATSCDCHLRRLSWAQHPTTQPSRGQRRPVIMHSLLLLLLILWAQSQSQPAQVSPGYQSCFLSSFFCV